MTILSAQSIARVKPIDPILPRTLHPQSGCSYGLSAAGYDIRLDQDIVLRPGEFCLASTIERFTMPNNVLGRVCDKSTWIRRGLCVFNTVIEPGWRGFLTLELKNVHPERGAVSVSIGGDNLLVVDDYIDQKTIRLAQGTPIAQVLFEFLDAHTELPYDGKYQDQERGPVAPRDGAGYTGYTQQEGE